MTGQETVKFAGKVAVVTGGGRGIGWAIARQFASRGAAIAIADIDGEAARNAAGELAREGTDALGVACDVADEAMTASAMVQISSTLGGIDMLINNAGRHLLRYAVPITQLPVAEWRAMLDVNIIGIVNCSAACRPSMRERGGGVIVNMGSIAGSAATNCYGVSKLAVRGLTVGLAKEFAGDGIRVCGIAPGLVDSPAAMAEMPAERTASFIRDLQLVRRQGTMQDVAHLAEFLCSDKASFITGETINVSGGFPLQP